MIGHQAESEPDSFCISNPRGTVQVVSNADRGVTLDITGRRWFVDGYREIDHGALTLSPRDARWLAEAITAAASAVANTDPRGSDTFSGEFKVRTTRSGYVDAVVAGTLIPNRGWL